MPIAVFVLSILLQEDAQEFLDFLLDALHEEIVSAGGARYETDAEAITSATASSSAAPYSTPAGLAEAGAPTVCDTSMDWQEVGRRRRETAVLNASPRRPQTPVSVLFHGRLRSEVRKLGTGGRVSVTFQPFGCLQLDIRVRICVNSYLVRVAILSKIDCLCWKH